MKHQLNLIKGIRITPNDLVSDTPIQLIFRDDGQIGLEFWDEKVWTNARDVNEGINYLYPENNSDTSLTLHIIVKYARLIHVSIELPLHPHSEFNQVNEIVFARLHTYICDGIDMEDAVIELHLDDQYLDRPEEYPVFYDEKSDSIGFRLDQFNLQEDGKGK